MDDPEELEEESEGEPDEWEEFREDEGDPTRRSSPSYAGGRPSQRAWVARSVYWGSGSASDNCHLLKENGVPDRDRTCPLAARLSWHFIVYT
jgi:hypothetical protein